MILSKSYNTKIIAAFLFQFVFIRETWPLKILVKETSIFFPPIFILWQENHPLKTLKSNVLSYVLANWKNPMPESVKCSTVPTVKTFYYQILANLPSNATEIVLFLKMYENWVFNENDGIFLKSAKVANLLASRLFLMLLNVVLLLKQYFEKSHQILCNGWLKS